MVMNKASSEIDKIAELKSLGQGPGEHIRELKKLGGAIANLENQSLPDYFTFLFEIFEKAECPKHVAGGNDLSAARKRLNEKLNKMGARLLEDEEQLPEVAVAATASKESQPQRYLRKIS